MAGSSRGGLLESDCAIAPLLVWVNAAAEWLVGKHRAEGWAIRGPGHPYSLWKRFGSESCLWRRRGLLELCQRLPKFSEPRAGGVSISLKRHCSLTACLLLGSFCPAHVSPSVSADLLSECTSTWCPRMSGRKNWQAWHTASISRQLMPGPTPLRTKSRRSVCPCTALPNPCRKHLVVTTFLLCTVSRITPHFSQKGSLQWARACGGIRDTKPLESFKWMGGTLLEGSRVALNCRGSLRWDSCCHLHWVDNCAQERNSLAGWQYALGKVDPEPQAI